MDYDKQTYMPTDEEAEAIDCTGVFAGMPRPLSEDVGRELLAWLETGEEAPSPPPPAPPPPARNAYANARSGRSTPPPAALPRHHPREELSVPQIHTRIATGVATQQRDTTRLAGVTPKAGSKNTQPRRTRHPKTPATTPKAASKRPAI